jgi:hypothetical protein
MTCCLLGFGCRELSVVVRMSSYLSLPDGGAKAYSKRKTLSPIIVDSSSYVLLQLINHIVENFVWGSKQYISLFCATDVCDEVCVPIKSDEELHELFNMNLENGVVHIDAQIIDFDGPIQFSPTKHRLHPTMRERVQEKVLETASTPSLDLVSFVNPTQVTQETSHKVSDTHTKEGARTTKEGATTTKKART